VTAPEIRDADGCPHRRVLDGSLLCELLHPSNDPSLPLRCSIAHAVVSPDARTLPHRLRRSTEVYYILAGKGEVHLGAEVVAVHPGRAVVIPPGTTQWCRNTGGVDLVFLTIVDPFWQADDEELV